MADLTLAVGRVYRGKHVRNCGGLVHDRLRQDVGEVSHG